MPHRSLAGERVLVVLAHPDDESLACGGTLALLARHGCPVHLVCATRGECGHVAGGQGSPGDLASVRAHELRDACETLRIPSHELLPFPDGELTNEGQDALIDALERRLRSWRPSIVITFGRDGLYWHPDHVAVGERVRSAIARCAHDVPVTGYGVTMPPGAMGALADVVRHAVPSVERAFWGVPPEVFGFAARVATRALDVTSVLDLKVEALRRHQSQLGPSNPLTHLTPVLARPLAIEHFSLLETSPLHRSALDELSRDVQD
jgi:LmbE family N-acetylglucosaminyl deacetylase